ncbi:MAG: type II toxin-antitoxin system VapC family toxin [Acidobacteria bacterium]|nr:type II toxin-antitoxin system VapC family toxin [Acidobacteriota bacterium]
MSYLVDTCAVSELIKPQPSASVFAWFRHAPAEALFVSVLTLGEIRKGVASMPVGRRRERNAAWLRVDLPRWFEDRILPVGPGVADNWGRLAARVPNLPVADGLIAATALHHQLAIVTRNEGDFAQTGVEIVNPWKQ